MYNSHFAWSSCKRNLFHGSNTSLVQFDIYADGLGNVRSAVDNETSLNTLHELGKTLAHIEWKFSVYKQISPERLIVETLQELKSG